MSLRVTIVTLFPEMFQGLTDYGISGRAVERGLLDLELLNPRDFTSDKHRTVDDRPYGGGPGMLMKVAPLRAALAAAGEQRHVVYLSPQGRKCQSAGGAGIAASRAPGIALRSLRRR